MPAPKPVSVYWPAVPPGAAVVVEKIVPPVAVTVAFEMNFVVGDAGLPYVTVPETRSPPGVGVFVAVPAGVEVFVAVAVAVLVLVAVFVGVTVAVLVGVEQPPEPVIKSENRRIEPVSRPALSLTLSTHVPSPFEPSNADKGPVNSGEKFPDSNCPVTLVMVDTFGKAPSSSIFV